MAATVTSTVTTAMAAMLFSSLAVAFSLQSPSHSSGSSQAMVVASLDGDSDMAARWFGDGALVKFWRHQRATAVNPSGSSDGQRCSLDDYACDGSNGGDSNAGSTEVAVAGLRSAATRVDSDDGDGEEPPAVALATERWLRGDGVSLLSFLGSHSDFLSLPV
ncbi:uncharacterized protein DS421_12g366890 [Arachis hypogaea]|nr:uncharacterized protein DS421_12g366890 [Arachis hypogaea]